MIANINFILPTINILPVILDWLDDEENNNYEVFDNIIRFNMLNLISILTNILHDCIEYFNLRLTDDMDPHELITLLLGYQ